MNNIKYFLIPLIIFLLIIGFSIACGGTPSTTTVGTVEKNEPETEPKEEEVVREEPEQEPESYEIEIIGDNDFVEETNKALNLLKSKAPIHYAIIERYIGVIEWVEAGSGMFAWEDPPLYRVGEVTVNEGTIWYAGTIVHDSVHSKQYHDYLAENPSGPVPDEVWTGENAEAQCLNVQHDALEKIGADQQTLDWIKSVIETKYWEVPYEERWW